MPWSAKNPPSVAKNWPKGDQKKCVDAANAVLREGGSEGDAIRACIRNAGRTRNPGGRSRSVDLPMLDRLAVVESVSDPDKGDGGADRTARVVWTTGAEVRRLALHGGDIKIVRESLSLANGHVDLSRMTGAPFLKNHERTSIDSVVGVVERAWIENGVGRAELKFSRRPDVDTYWADVKDGILRQVSIGYMVDRYEDVSEEGDAETHLRAVRWTPMEVSLVPIAADAGAGFRAAHVTNPCEIIERADDAQTEEDDMAEKTSGHDHPAGAESAGHDRNVVDMDALKREARNAALADAGRILRACADAGFPELGAELVERGCSLTDAIARVEEAREIRAAVSIAKLPPETTGEFLRNGASLVVAQRKILEMWAARGGDDRPLDERLDPAAQTAQPGVRQPGSLIRHIEEHYGKGRA